MSETLDELDINAFYNFLQTNQKKKFERAQELCCLVCIPVSRTLSGINFTQNFADYHLLKPSPYCQGEYSTMHTKGKIVSLVNDDHLVTSAGFPSEVSVKILHEELSYSKTYKAYKILIIERPLDPDIQIQADSNPPILATESTFKYTFEECKDLLLSYTDLKAVITELDDKLDKFERNYMILRTSLPDASKRLHSISTSIFQKCLSTSQELNSNARLADIIYYSLECYTVGKVYSKIHPVFESNLRLEDSQLHDKISQLSSLTLAELGIKEKFRHPLPLSIQELIKLNSYTTPLAKLHCIRSVLETIKDEIARHHQDYKALGAPALNKMLFTSDDLIPILLNVMCQSGCKHLASNISFIEHFTWSQSFKGELSFCFTTLKACVEYAKNLNINRLRVQYSTMQKEKEGVTISPSGQSLKSSASERERCDSSRSDPSLGRIDEQLDKMARLLNESTNQLSDRLQRKPTADIFSDHRPKSQRNENRKAELGAFLASLDEDEVGSSFG